MSAVRVPITVWFDSGHIARLRAAVRGMQAAGHERVSLAAMIDVGAVVVAQRLEQTHNDGARWPLIDDALAAGRRPK